MNKYKGIKGGDPALRPPKVLLTYSCPSCSKPTQAMVDAGRRGKHECGSCRQLRNERQQGLHHPDEKCKGCSTTKNITYSPEYFDVEVYGYSDHVYLCDSCRRAYAEDI